MSDELTWRVARSYLGDLWNESEPTTWEQAHADMVKRFERWTHDDCPPCARNATEQLPTLKALTPNTEWIGDLEGDDYVIIHTNTTIEQIEQRIYG